MLRRSLLATIAGAVLATGCGGGGNKTDGAATAPSTTTSTTAAGAAATPTSAPPTTVSPIEGVQTFTVAAGHSDQPQTYPQVPPVGGIHNPVWQACTFYDRPVPNEMAVHSLEHGAIWLTYRADLPAADLDALATLARSRKDVLASRWDDGLPAPLVATAWGRQLRLESAGDPRLAAFVRLYANQGPEVNAPC